MKVFYSWQEFAADIVKISAWANGRDFDSVYGIPRGGLIAAVSLSHRLNLPLKLNIKEINEKTLVVDDISDSGKTLEKFEKQLSFKPVVATLFYHKDTSAVPDFYAREKTYWVIFPWETGESSKYDNILKEI